MNILLTSIIAPIISGVIGSILFNLYKENKNKKKALKEMSDFEKRIEIEFIEPLDNYYEKNKNKNYNNKPKSELEELTSEKTKKINRISKEIKYMKGEDNKLRATKIVEDLKEVYAKLYNKTSYGEVRMYKDFSAEEIKKGKERSIDNFYKNYFPEIKEIISTQKILD